MTSRESNRPFVLALAIAFALVAIAIGLRLGGDPLPQFATSSFELLRDTILQWQAALAAESATEDTALWQWLAIAFSTVFVAEMGDKTQLATMLMSARGQSPWSIFFGSASALVAASLVSVTLGGWAASVVEPQLLQAIAGGSFILLGLYALWAELTGADSEDESVANEEASSSDGI